MKMRFYDVKKRENVEAEVTGKQTYSGKSGERFAVKAQTTDGRNLTRFVSRSEYDSIAV